MPEIPARSFRRTWVRRAVPAGVVAVLVVAGTALVRTNASASPTDTYRTTSVTIGSVEQRLDLTGSVQRVNQVSQSFSVSGTVSSVSAAVGDAVTAGQSLATLEPGPLASAIIAARADLARAKAALESDQVSATTTTAAASTRTVTSRATTVTRASTPTTGTRSTTPSGRSGGGQDPRLTRAQKDLTSGERALAADLGLASSALARCAPFFPSASPVSGPPPVESPSPSPTTVPETTPPPTGGPTSTPTDTETTTPTTTVTTTPSSITPSAAEIQACLGALRTAPTQQQIQKDQRTVTRNRAGLNKAVTLAITTAATSAKASTATKSSGTSSRPSTSQSASSQPSTSQSVSSQSGSSQSAGGPNGGSGQSATARLVSDQADVTSAEATLSSATADQSAATLKSSIAGTVGSISLVKGASSDGKTITIVGAGAVEVTVNVPLASMATVHVGQKANVTPQGATSSLPGAVTSISLLPFTSTTGTGGGATQATTQASSPVYPVVVLVPNALPSLASGSRANVSLLIGTASHVITVANSALTPLGNGQALALTFKNGVATRALVRTGYAGTLTTQITSGLTVGQQVVLADLSTALPTNTTNARRFGVGGGAAGGFGAAGLGGAGLGGAGLGGAGLGGGAITGRTGVAPRG